MLLNKNFFSKQNVISIKLTRYNELHNVTPDFLICLIILTKWKELVYIKNVAKKKDVQKFKLEKKITQKFKMFTLQMI
jgi:hypothetical protein